MGTRWMGSRIKRRRVKGKRIKRRRVKGKRVPRDELAHAHSAQRHQYSEGSVHLVRRKDPKRQFSVEDRVIYYYCQSDEPHLLDFKERLPKRPHDTSTSFGQRPQRGRCPVEHRGKLSSATCNLTVFSLFAVLKGTLGGLKLEDLKCPKET